MPRKASQLLDRMRASKAGWSRKDLASLYIGYGFVITHGASHDIVKHPRFPALRATLPRHDKLAKAYVTLAVALVDRLQELEAGGTNGP